MEKFDAQKQKEAEDKFDTFKNYDYKKEDFEKVFENEEKIKHKSSFFGENAEYVCLFFEMLKDFFTGRYKKVPIATIASIICTLLYILSPIDLIPDFIPIAGLLDDASILATCVAFCKRDIDEYKKWKNSRTLG